MNKADLIANVSMDADISRAAAGKAVESMLETIAKAISKGDKVTLVGFGAFSSVTRKERAGRNPRTGLAAVIPKHKAPHFKPSPTLKARLN